MNLQRHLATHLHSSAEIDQLRHLRGEEKTDEKALRAWCRDWDAEEAERLRNRDEEGEIEEYELMGIRLGDDVQPSGSIVPEL